MLTDEEFSLLTLRHHRELQANFFTDGIPQASIERELCQWHNIHCHSHIQREIMIPLTGEIMMRIEKKFFLCPSSSVLLIESNEVHSHGFHPKCEGLYLWIFLYSNLLTSNIYRFENETISPELHHICTKYSVVSMFNEAWEKLISHTPGGDMEITALCDLVLCDIHQNANKRVVKISSQENNIRMICQYLASSCGRRNRIDDLAKMANCSRQHFMRSFKKITGSTVKEFIESNRHSKYRENVNKLPLKELADLLGFESPAALCHWRKKQVPSDKKI